MNETQRDIMLEIFKTTDLKNIYGQKVLMNSFNECNEKLTEIEEIYNEPGYEKLRTDILKCQCYAMETYETMIYQILFKFVEEQFGHSLDFVILNYSQEEIMSKLYNFLKPTPYPDSFKRDIILGIKKAAENLDRRFAFDELALINLIEASSGKNIYTEQENNSRSSDDRYIVKTKNGYGFKKTKRFKENANGTITYIKDRRTIDNRKLLNPLGSENLELDKVPVHTFQLSNVYLQNKESAMKKIMEHLFENLDLCIETYNSIYSSGDNVVKNTAHLGDGTNFNFDFVINEVNIPHLLGIPKPSTDTISKESLKILNAICHNGYPKLSYRSNALELLNFLREHQNEIISLGGLYESNGKKYEILNWEKIIIKTASFMRGDFFKTCFCLAQLAPSKYLSGKYASISSTKYNKGIGTTATAKSVLYDLLNATRQKNDYIFRGIDSSGDRNFVRSIRTGKAETITAGKQKEVIKTLQRFRNLLNDSNYYQVNSKVENDEDSGAYFGNSMRDEDKLLTSIAQDIVNENYIKTFTPEEQAALGLSISRDFSLTPALSYDAVNVLENVQKRYGTVSQDELEKFIKVFEKNKGRSRH